MRMSLPLIAIVCGGALVLALALLVAGMLLSATVIIALPIAGIIGLVLLHRPFLGLVLLVAISQLDTLANIISQDLPISIVKLLTLAVLGAVIVESYREPRSNRLGPPEPALKFALLYCVALLLSYLLADDADAAAWSIRRLLGLVVLFYLVVRMVRDQRQLEWVVLAIIGSTLFSSVIVLYDSLLGQSLLATSFAASEAEFEGMARSSGASDQDPTTTATMLLAGTLLALFLATKTPKWRWLNISTTLLGTGAIMFSFARSSALAYGLAIAWLVWKYRRHRSFLIVVGTVMFSGLAALPFVPGEYLDRLASMGDIESDVTLQRRITYTRIGIELLSEYPVFGVGPGNFQVRYIDEPYRTYGGRKLIPRLLHNMFLSVAVEVGFVGLFGFLGLIIAGVVGTGDAAKRAESKDIRILAEATQFAYVPFLFASMFVPNEYNKYTWIMAGLAVAVTRIAGLRNPQGFLFFGKRGP